MAKRSREPVTVVIDTRERKPYSFPHSVSGTLAAGDYSIPGMERLVAVERKTKQDAFSSLGSGRRRFEREMKRLAELNYAAVVIEANLPEFLQPPPFTRMNPKAALNSILAWSVKYRVHVFFAGDRRHGNALVLRLLEKYHRYRLERESKEGAS